MHHEVIRKTRWSHQNKLEKLKIKIFNFNFNKMNVNFKFVADYFKVKGYEF